MKREKEPIGKIVTCSINTNYGDIDVYTLKKFSYEQFCEWIKSKGAKDVPMTLTETPIYSDTPQLNYVNEEMDDFLVWYVPNEDYHLPKVIGFVFESGYMTPKMMSEFVNSLTYEQCYALSMYDLRVHAYTNKDELVEFMNTNHIRKDTGTIIQKYIRLF